MNFLMEKPFMSFLIFLNFNNLESSNVGSVNMNSNTWTVRWQIFKELEKTEQSAHSCNLNTQEDNAGGLLFSLRLS